MSDQDDDGVGNGDDSLAQRRGRRTRNDKGGRVAALEKLKNARLQGAKNKYEVKEVNNVYDVVDEDTYSKKVNDRLLDDWIVDDGTGYCETGHELFDDDIVEQDDYPGSSRRNKNVVKKKDKVSKEERENQKANFLSVRDMLQNMPAKKKKNEEGPSTSSKVKEKDGDDDILGELMQELLDNKKPQKINMASFRAPVSLEPSKLGRQSDELKRKRENADFSFLKTFNENEEEKKTKKVKKTLELYRPSTTDASREHDFAIDNDQGIGDLLAQDEIKVEPVWLDSMADDAFLADVEMPEVISTTVNTVKKETKKPSLNIKMEAIMKFETEEMVLFDSAEPEYEAEAVVESEQLGADKLLNFYWYDIYEEPKNPGVLYLFGKVGHQGEANGYVSCCLVVQNVERWMYVLPREKMRDDETEDVSMKDVYDEFEALAKKFKIPVIKSRPVEKKYCFGGDNDEVPLVSEYLEVAYSGSLPPLPEDLQGNTFCKVFGTNAPLMENFVLTKKLKGPCWLQIKNPVTVDSSQQQSWCRMELSCRVQDIQIHPQKDSLSVPPFVVASLTVNSVNDPASRKDVIISLSVAVNRMFKLQSSAATDGLFHDSFCLLHKPPGEVWPFDVDRALNKFTTKMESERSMLACFLAKLQQFDPDVYIGHDLNFDLLLTQLWQHKVPHWSRIGRLKRSSQPIKGNKMPDTRTSIAGRLACDVKTSAMELIRARSYDLTSLACQVLGLTEEQVPSYTGAELRQLFESSEGIQHLITWSISLSVVNLRIVKQLQVMPLALQITTIAGNTLGRTLMGGRSERNEYLLLHAFYNKGYIVPEKRFRKKFKKEDEDDITPESGKKGKSGGPSYVGGLVLEPKKGFYDNFIVLMDFNSLYPSIIQEFNVCFTTTTTSEHTDDTERGILPEEIRRLVESRREVKKLMKAENLAPELRKQYDIRQMALKLTANSMYGCLGFQYSRFYAMRLAALITGKGREILLKTKEAVEKMGFEVIYGDTDSLMINTNTQDIQKVYQIGYKIKHEINRMYKLLELEIDGVYRFLLLLKKKKYAALSYSVKPNGDVQTALELKGLDIVRRDWAPVAANTARSVVEQIMSEQLLDDKVFNIVKILNEKAQELRSGQVPKKDLLITKQLAKNPEDYKDQQGLYHVKVAIRMNQSGKLPRKFKNGDTVPYLFCTDGLAHHPVELVEAQSAKSEAQDVKHDPNIKEATLEPDPVYYLSNQMHPVVSRICEPIPGLDGARIAEALGLDPSGYKRKRTVEANSDDHALGETIDKDRYKDCAKFEFLCPNPECKAQVIVDDILVQVGGKRTLAIMQCPGCAISFYGQADYLCNRLVLFMRKFIEKYYQAWFECEDPACSNRERGCNLPIEQGYFICPCKQGVMVREYTESALNKQLEYLLYVFDLEKRLEDVGEGTWPKDKDAGVIYGRLKNVVETQLTRSAYSQIDLSDLFGELMPKQKFAFSKKTSKAA